jgi:3-methyladenine DNA glycosylase AlkD
LLGKYAQTILLDGFDRLGRNPQTDETIAFRPPEALPLKIDFLEFVGSNVGVGDGHRVVRLLPGQLTSTRHGWVSKLKKYCTSLMQLSSIAGSVVIREALFPIVGQDVMTKAKNPLSDKALTQIKALQVQLDRAADPATKAWFEAYLKGVIPFRGLKLPQVKAITKEWYKSIKSFSLTDQTAIAFALLEASYSEDKLAGIVLLQEQLIPQGAIEQTHLPRFAQVFQSGAIADWSTCDWFCMRVLNLLVKREGEACARAISTWKDAENLWQQRASCIPFVTLAKQGDEFFPGFTDLLLTVGETVVRSEERFSQTAVGWLWRELWVGEPERVVGAIEANLTQFSSEGLRYATEKMPREEQLRLRGLRKERLVGP